MAVNPDEGTVGSSMDRAVAELDSLFNPTTDEAEVPDEVSQVEEEAETEEVEAETVDDDAEPDEEEAEEVEATVESLADVAEALGMSLDDLLATLKHRVKVDGETFDVPLSELQAGYQKDRDYRQKTEALKRERESFEQALAQKHQRIEDEHRQNAFVLNSVEQQLIRAYNSEEMERLKATNPQQYMLRRMEMQEQMQGLHSLKAEAAQRYEVFKTEQDQEKQQTLQKTLEEEARLLSDAIPSWGSELRGKLTTFLSDEYGYKPEEIGGFTDHRLVKMAYESMLFRQQQSKVQEATKKVKKAPKLVKPNPQKTTGQIRRDSLNALRGKVKKTGKLRDAAAYIEHLL